MKTDSRNQVCGMKGLRDRIRGALRKQACTAFRIGHRRQNKKRRTAFARRTGLAHSQQFFTIQAGHLEIKENQIRGSREQQLESLNSIIRFEHSVKEPRCLEGRSHFCALAF